MIENLRFASMATQIFGLINLINRYIHISSNQLLFIFTLSITSSYRSTKIAKQIFRKCKLKPCKCFCRSDYLLRTVNGTLIRSSYIRKIRSCLEEKSICPFVIKLKAGDDVLILVTVVSI